MYGVVVREAKLCECSIMNGGAKRMGNIVAEDVEAALGQSSDEVQGSVHIGEGHLAWRGRHGDKMVRDEGDVAENAGELPGLTHPHCDHRF